MTEPNLNFRDPMSGLTHFIAALLAIPALIFLLIRDHPTTDILYSVSFSIFGSAMILLYTFSTLYHWLPVSGKRLELFRKIDHIMIFIFIAASYTPICLISLGGGWGWAIFGSVWGIALGGLFIKLFWLHAPRILYTAIYLLMGWIIIIAIWPLYNAMSSGGLFWLAIGGVFYSVGAVIYAFKRPDPWPGFFGFHETFHLFIMGGSFSHFWMMYRFV